MVAGITAGAPGASSGPSGEAGLPMVAIRGITPLPTMIRFPYLIAEVKDQAGNLLRIRTDIGVNGSIVTFPKGMGKKHYFAERN